MLFNKGHSWGKDDPNNWYGNIASVFLVFVFWYGVGGNVKIEANGTATEFDVKFKNKVSSSDDETVYYVKAIDAGANFLVGYEFPFKLSFQLNAQLGLLNFEPEYEGETADETILKNTGFGFSLGFRFWNYSCLN